MNKKGIMVKFLVAVVLAIIVFTPTCIFTSKLFRLSTQAQDNFGDILKEIKEVAQSEEGEAKTLLLITDPETSIVSFKANEDHNLQYEVCDTRGRLKTCEVLPYTSRQVGYEGGERRFDLTSTTYPYPTQCAGNDCICLCQERIVSENSVREETKEDEHSGDSLYFRYLHQEIICSKMLCQPLEGIEVEPFHFVRENREDLRRELLEIKKEDGKVKLTLK
jgi:hypothetical protein